MSAFLDSWSLFQTTYLSGWLIGVMLAVVGVWVVARDQIFVGIAISQASALGIALSLWAGGVSGLAWIVSDASASTLAVVASVSTALLTARVRTEAEESAEAVTGWVFLVAASLPVLMLAHSPHGLEEIHRLTFSTLLGATATDVTVLGLAALATVALVWRLHPPLLLMALDPETAVVFGVRRRRLWLGTAVWLGVSVGLSMRVAGMLYTFGCLVLPALIAKNLAREIRPLLWLSPAISLAAGVPGFVLAHHFDLPPAHTTVTLLCGGLGAAWVVRRVRS